MEELSKGYERFRNGYFKHNRARLEQLAEKQAPQIAILSCRDSRVDPGDISNKLERYDREKRRQEHMGYFRPITSAHTLWVRR